MNKKKAFSRIELMVVVVIGACLMATLLPAGAQVRKSARDAACLMNIRQLGICFDMYTKDNNTYFSDGMKAVSGSGGAGIGDWLTALDGGYKFEAPMTQAEIDQTRDLHRGFSYIKDYEILKCPMAPIASSEVPVSFRAWGGGPGHENMGVNGNSYLPYNENAIGGYAFNAWCNNVPQGMNRVNWGMDVHYCWRTTDVEGAADVPVVADSYRWAASPMGDNSPPSFEGEYGGTGTDEIRRICINRHDGAVNILFMDWSVRRVRLTQLWDVNMMWNRNWVTEITEAGQPDFETEAPWMSDF